MFSRRDPRTSEFPAKDRGSGHLDHYDYNLAPRGKKVVIELAGSDPHQDELRRAIEQDGAMLTSFIPRRSYEEERDDAPTLVRLFVAGRPSSVVGQVPRGLEPVIEAALMRLAERGEAVRIPVQIVSSKAGLRARLLMSATK